ncbi:hypothetical protein PCASD_00930 [Puccinia coronata f. sp. avenae]|uniref:Uncharacterized protein n=1 Tax=Puccinia coronata f. sp. avenae TaxID=200324 RepID=A0A2N5VPI5_9BASI|nr:hypothetical protein PCASD_00930 [Puccinia coronata f. sp. avenae]
MQAKLMIKSSGQQDATLHLKPGKQPVQISDLRNLHNFLTGQSPEEEEICDLAIEVPHPNDVKIQQGTLILVIRKSKTAKPEELQQMQLKPPTNDLCPAKAIQHRLVSSTTVEDSLFGCKGPKGRVHLKKRRVNKVLKAARDCRGCHDP